MEVDKTNKEEVQNLDTVLGMEVGEVVEGEGEGAGFLTQESDVGWTTLVDTYNRFKPLRSMRTFLKRYPLASRSMT